MAGEAVNRSYGYLPGLSHDQTAALITAATKSELGKLRGIRASRPKPPRFFHNDLHDLESLWWIPVWKLFRDDCFYLAMDARDDADRDVMRRAVFSNLFGAPDGHRWSFFNNQGIYERETTWIPDELHLVRYLLTSLREAIICNYNRFEAEFPSIRTDLLAEAHEKVSLHFEAGRLCLDTVKDAPANTEPQQSLRLDQDCAFTTQEGTIPPLGQDSASSDGSFCDLGTTETVCERKQQADPSEISAPAPLSCIPRCVLQCDRQNYS